jgi:hypothetical protein
LKLVERIELAMSRAAYPDVHPDFTDASWRRMADAVLSDLLNGPTQSMVDAAYAERDRIGLAQSQGRPAAEFKAMIAQAIND